jgi:hypothetical protein
VVLSPFLGQDGPQVPARGSGGSSLSPGMAHRIEVELTSQTGDTTWTWRAAGAKQPRGTVDATLVPEGSAVGTVLRAEVETTLDGTTVVALSPAKAKGDVRAIQRIEVLGTPQRGPDVNVVLAAKSRGRTGRGPGPLGSATAQRRGRPARHPLPFPQRVRGIRRIRPRGRTRPRPLRPLPPRRS